MRFCSIGCFGGVAPAYRRPQPFSCHHTVGDQNPPPAQFICAPRRGSPRIDLSRMSTYPSVTAPPRTSRLTRILLWIVLPVLLLLLIASATFYWLAHSALPQLDGTLSVPGLSAPVTVTRDARGIPTIEAANLDDLFFAQGYVTAQDRLWQMDGMRRAAAGELSEVVGEVAFEHDRQQRILGLRDVAEKGLASVTP